MFIDSVMVFFLFKQKSAYELRISDLSSDVCSSDLNAILRTPRPPDPLCCVAAPQTGDPMLLYQMHELGRAWMAPFTYWADANARMFSADDRWLSSIPGASRISAGNALLHRIVKDTETPSPGLHAVEWVGHNCRVIDKVGVIG